MLSRRIKIVATIVLTIIILVVAYSSYYFYNRKIFTVEKWEKNIWNREYMFDDFLQKYDFIEMPKEKVKELLGESGLVNGDDTRYYIGKGWIGPVMLYISYDDDDKVSKYGIVVD